MRFKKIITFILAAGICMPVLAVFQPHTVEAATENDLREVMGTGRLDTDEKAKALAMSTIRECTKNKQHNELVDMLKDYKLEDYTDQLELAESGEQAYGSIMKAFKGAESVSKITESLSAYETYFQNWQGEESHVSYDLEKIDDKDIEKKLKHANAILATINSMDDIGMVGIDMVPPIKEDRMLVTGMTEDSASFYVTKNQKIYSILTGSVKSVGVNYVILECGSTINISYYGIHPNVESGQHISQGRKIGTSIGTELKISAEITDEPENPLLMYGKRGVFWYQEYQDGSALDTDEMIMLPTDKVKDFAEEQPNKSENPGKDTELSPFDNHNEDAILESDPFLPNPEDQEANYLPSADDNEESSDAGE